MSRPSVSLDMGKNENKLFEEMTMKVKVNDGLNRGIRTRTYTCRAGTIKVK